MIYIFSGTFFYNVSKLHLRCIRKVKCILEQLHFQRSTTLTITKVNIELTCICVVVLQHNHKSFHNNRSKKLCNTQTFQLFYTALILNKNGGFISCTLSAEKVRRNMISSTIVNVLLLELLLIVSIWKKYTQVCEIFTIFIHYAYVDLRLYSRKKGIFLFMTLLRF